MQIIAVIKKLDSMVNEFIIQSTISDSRWCILQIKHENTDVAMKHAAKISKITADSVINIDIEANLINVKDSLRLQTHTMQINVDKTSKLNITTESDDMKLNEKIPQHPHDFFDINIENYNDKKMQINFVAYLIKWINIKQNNVAQMHMLNGHGDIVKSICLSLKLKNDQPPLLENSFVVILNAGISVYQGKCYCWGSRARMIDIVKFL